MKQSGIVLLKISQKFNIDLDYAEECLLAAEYIWGEKPEPEEAKVEVDSRRYQIVQRQVLSLMEDLKDRFNGKPQKFIRPKGIYTNREYSKELMEA